MPTQSGITANPVGPTSGGKITAINNLSTSPAIVIAGNPSRVSIMFHNPGTVTVYVAPVLQPNGTSLSPSLAALGGCFEIFPGGFSPLLTGECQGAFQAFAASGTGQPLTVVESNV